MYRSMYDGIKKLIGEVDKDDQGVVGNKILRSVQALNCSIHDGAE
jgi:hypothetical protein